MSLQTRINHRYNCAIASLGETETEQLRIRHHAYAVGYVLARTKGDKE